MFKKKVDKSISKLDKIVTGLIIGGALASVFGATKTGVGKRLFANGIDGVKKVFGFSFHFFGKSLVKVITIFKKFK